MTGIAASVDVGSSRRESFVSVVGWFVVAAAVGWSD